MVLTSVSESFSIVSGPRISPRSTIAVVLSIGISYSSVGAISFTIGAINISLSGLAVGSLVGIILNAVLPGKDYSFDAKGEESANLKV